MGMFQSSFLALLMVIALVVPPAPVYADESSSTNYRVDQTFFGTGGELDNASANFRAKTSVGELGVGDTASASYLAKAGFNTAEDPFIEFVVDATNVDLGTLTTASTASTSGTFQVRAWRAAGYAVTTAADPPRNGTYTLSTANSPTAAAPGTEQFGINLVANTTPSVGAAPVQLPDNTFSFGQVDTAYATANVYKYTKGDRIAFATQSTSITRYTVSYIYNISTLTAGGEYKFNHIMVATGTY